MAICVRCWSTRNPGTRVTPSTPKRPTRGAVGISHYPAPLGFRPRVLCCSGTGTWAICTASPMWWPLTPGWPFGSITGLPCDLFRPAVLNIRHGTRVQHQTQHRRFHADSNLAPRFMTIFYSVARIRKSIWKLHLLHLWPHWACIGRNVDGKAHVPPLQTDHKMTATAHKTPATCQNDLDADLS